MLRHLELSNVGPAPKLEIDFAERLNLITGDNGLGKSFLLDVAWWALTQTWAREMARPAKGVHRAVISAGFDAETPDLSRTSPFHWSAPDQDWFGLGVHPASEGMVVYAHVDGGFAVWDPARNHWTPRRVSAPIDRIASYVFTADEVWNGLEQDGISLCEGLVRDWASWQKENGEAFRQFRAVLEGLSPSPHERLVPGGFARLGFQARDIPTLHMPYGQDVPVLHASAGMRRIIALAYLLVWTWQEHVKTSELIGKPPVNEITFLIDELESHLHPQWQRRILRSLLGVMEALTGKSDVRVQVITATHSPLLLASLEPLFDPDRDALWTLDLVENEVKLSKMPWRRRGDANRWLTSEALDLAIPRSLEAEAALQRADALLREAEPDLAKLREVNEELRGVLPDDDPFWARWGYFLEQRGVG
jgi:AAA domain, putative AbiEii toxin, Type IV TA system/AAA domain